MKNLLTIALFVAFPLCMFAQTEFEKAIISALTEFGSAQTNDELKAVEAKFERISVAEPTQWIPRYYVAFINCNMAFRTQDVAQIKLYTDKALNYVNEALKIAPQESELFTLQGMVYQAIIGIDPMNNGMVYSGKATGSFETAKALNPANPRPYYLQGISVMYTPEQYGGGKKAALGLLNQANGLFASFQPSSPIAPNWGKEDCLARIEECNKN